LIVLQAEDFHQKGQALLDWLASAERQLRYRGALPEEELPLLKQIEEHKVHLAYRVFMSGKIVNSLDTQRQSCH
jgi:hypothetical protein